LPRINEVCRTLAVPTRGTAVHFTCSIGVTEVNSVDDSLEAVLRRADAALYDAKRSGRDCSRPGSTPPLEERPNDVPSDQPNADPDRAIAPALADRGDVATLTGRHGEPNQ
jgi:hypothetical protein